jgi:branched-chain amino acid transport system ATP-binding protein
MQIIELLKGLRAEGLTILLIEHDMDWVQKLCDRLLVMHHGELIASGTFEQVTQNPIVLEAYLGR